MLFRQARGKHCGRPRVLGRDQLVLARQILAAGQFPTPCRQDAQGIRCNFVSAVEGGGLDPTKNPPTWAGLMLFVVED